MEAFLSSSMEIRVSRVQLGPGDELVVDNAFAREIGSNIVAPLARHCLQLPAEGEELRQLEHSYRVT